MFLILADIYTLEYNIFITIVVWIVAALLCVLAMIFGWKIHPYTVSQLTIFSSSSVELFISRVCMSMASTLPIIVITFFCTVRIEEPERLAAKESQARLTLEPKRLELKPEENAKKEAVKLNQKAEEDTTKEAEIKSRYHAYMSQLEDGNKTTIPPNPQQSDEEEQGVMNRDSDPAENTNTENTIEDANVKELPAISEPTAAEKTLSQALVGEWRLESRSYNENISFIADGTYISTLEYLRGPPAGTTAEFNGTWKVEKDELIQIRSGKIYKTKVRMISTTSFEEPTEDRNWPRIYSKVMEPKTSSDDSSLKQQRELESFLTTITQNDTVNSKGIPIMDPVLILMQDRANTHRFGNPDSDQVDQFFKLPTNRAKMSSFLERGSFPRDIQKSILSTNGLKLRIRIHSNNEGKICVDVSYANGLGNSSSNFSDDQKMMSFIDSESNFREEPGVNSAVKFQPRKGTRGRVLEHRGKWIKIQLDNGDIGWVFESNLK